MDPLAKLGGRKFVVTLVAVVAGLLTHGLGAGLTTEVVTLLLGVVGIFVSGNAMTTIKSLGLGNKSEPVADAVVTENPVASIQAQLDSIQQTVESAAQLTLQTQQIILAAVEQGNKK